MHEKTLNFLIYEKIQLKSLKEDFQVTLKTFEQGDCLYFTQ